MNLINLLLNRLIASSNIKKLSSTEMIDFIKIYNNLSVRSLVQGEDITEHKK